MSEFIDADARARIANDLDAALFVEAGAGSGKTTALTARIVSLVCGGTPLRNIVAITFTKAAASEMRERIRSALHKRLQLGKASEKDHLHRALDDINTASIQTIHAFAERILRKYGFHLGIAPSFEVLDSSHAVQLRTQTWRTFVDTIGQSATLPKLIDTSEMFSFDIRRRNAVFQAVLSHRDVLAQATTDDPPLQEEGVIHAFDALINAAQQLPAMQTQCCNDSDALFRNVMSITQDWLPHALVMPAESTAIDRARLATWFMGRKLTHKGNKGNWLIPIDDVRAVVSECEDKSEQVIAPYKTYVIQQVRSLILGCARTHVGSMRSQGLLDFDDLLVLSRDVLRIDEVRADMRRRFSYVFIDEFQDTDAVQCEIANLLTDAFDAGASTRQLFVVGDPKQSIYRFRGADVAQYRKARNSWMFDPTHLVTNFRSLPAVLTWINAMFAQLFPPEEWHPLASGRNESTGSVQVIGEALEDANAATVRAAECADVVTTIRDAVQSAWAIHEGDTVRPTTFADIALLLPARSLLVHIEPALRAANIPYRIESRSMVWKTDEINDLVMALRAIANRTDDVSLVGALRSPLFGVSDVELLEWHALGGAWDMFRPIPEALADCRIANAMQYLARLSHRREWMTPAELAEHLVNDRKAMLLPFAFPRRRESWNRIRFFLEQTRAWVVNHHGSLAEFLAWVEDRQARSNEDIEAPVAESDDDAVRIMTVHTAKGLEFPVVIVAGFGSLNTPRQSSVLQYEGDLRFNFASGLAEPEFADASNEAKNADLDELRRLLYVACTRAREHLVVSTWRKALKTVSENSNLLHHVCKYRDTSLEGKPEYITPVVHNEAVVHPCVSFNTLQDTIEQRRARILEVGARPTWLSATTLARARADSKLGFQAVRYGEEIDEWTTTSEGAVALAERRAFGTAVHRVLELCGVHAQRDDINVIVDDVAQEHGLLHARNAIFTSVNHALHSDVCQQARLADRVFYEMPVSMSEEKSRTIVGGSIDLVYENEEGLVVVDYKTESVDEGSIAAAAQRYGPQLVTYAAALGEASQQHVAYAKLLFIGPNMGRALAIDVSLDNAMHELSVLVQDASRHLRTISANEFDELATPTVRDNGPFEEFSVFEGDDSLPSGTKRTSG